ncbi:Carbamoyl-phosphate synthase [Candidatus Hepatincola sp. Pdp]
MEKVFIVFGYNNIRLFDVKKIQKIAKEKYAATIMLCREVITEEDKKNLDHTCLVDLTKQDSHSLEQQANIVIKFLTDNNLQAIGCLPFSDKGVQLGSLVAQKLNLFHDAYGEESFAAIDKFAFRQLEKKAKLPEWYKKVDCKIAYSKEDVYHFSKQYNKFFLKPNAEGGSRGCMAIFSKEDLKYWLDNFSNFLKQGAICEEYIDAIFEYSYDRIGNYEWLTEKTTTTGNFRAEPNHVAPAPLPTEQYNLLLQGGRLVSNIVGSKGGPCHMELFLTKDLKVACVEPNRRPAGVNIFEIGSVLYDMKGSSWEEWLRIASGGSIGKNYAEMCNNCFVLNRFLSSRKDLTIGDINSNYLAQEIKNKYPNKVLSFLITKHKGDKVFKNIVDNSGFIGMLLVQDNTYESVTNIANEIENMVQNYVERT